MQFVCLSVCLHQYDIPLIGFILLQGLFILDFIALLLKKKLQSYLDQHNHQPLECSEFICISFDSRLNKNDMYLGTIKPTAVNLV